VPFTAAVNVGTQYSTASWIDSGGAGLLTRENLSMPAGKGLLSLFGQLSNLSWQGCVRQRNEVVNGVTVNYDILDVSASATNPETLYTPYFAPDEPDVGWFWNSYLGDGTCSVPNRWNPTTAQERQDQSCIAKYPGGRVWNPQGTSTGFAANLFCPVQPVLPLTNDQSAILAEVQAMTANGNTVLPSGLMWGWNVISPNGPLVQTDSNGNTYPVSYTDTQTIKAIILVTDGDNNVTSGGGNNFNGGYYSAYGYPSGPHLTIYSVPQTSQWQGILQAEYNLIQKTLNICNNIKAVQDQNGNPRIIIYTIGLGDSISTTGQLVLQSCASDPTKYFANPTTDELVSTFQKIAVGLNALRIAK